jgi:hypothetical protein
MEDLVVAYLKWKYPASPTVEDDSATMAQTVEDDSATTAQAVGGDSATVAPLPSESPDFNFTAEAVDLYSLTTSVHITRPPSSKSAAIDAVAHGYLSPIPISPSILVSIPTLELFRRIRLRKPSFSVEAFTKVICDMYSVSLPPTRTLIFTNDSFTLAGAISTAIPGDPLRYL